MDRSRPTPRPKTDPKVVPIQNHRQEAIARETSKARELAKSPATKVKALNALRLRKVQEQLLDRVEGWILQVDELLLGIESAQATAVVLEKLKMGNEALRNAQRGYSLRDVESVLVDMDDAREHEEAVRAMIEGSLSAEDDEVCEAELAALEALEAREANDEPSEATTTRVAGTSGAVPTMPDVPEKAPDLPDAPLGLGTAGAVEEEEEERREALAA